MKNSRKTYLTGLSKNYYENWFRRIIKRIIKEIDNFFQSLKYLVLFSFSHFILTHTSTLLCLFSHLALKYQQLAHTPLQLFLPQLLPLYSSTPITLFSLITHITLFSLSQIFNFLLYLFFFSVSFYFLFCGLKKIFLCFSRKITKYNCIKKSKYSKNVLLHASRKFLMFTGIFSELFFIVLTYLKISLRSRFLQFFII